MPPGFGLPMNYIPREGDPGYIDDLYYTALSRRNLYDGFVTYVFLNQKTGVVENLNMVFPANQLRPFVNSR